MCFNIDVFHYCVGRLVGPFNLETHTLQNINIFPCYFPPFLWSVGAAGCLFYFSGELVLLELLFQSDLEIHAILLLPPLY